LLKTGPCPLFDLGASNELHRSTDRRTGRPRPRQLLSASEHTVKDHRDEILKSALVPEHVRPRQERIAKERLQRLEEPAR